MKKVSVLLLFIVIFCSGCWYYSFTEKAYPDIESVEIIPFDNETTEYDLADLITSGLIEDIDGSGLLEVRSKGADSRLEGSLVYFEREVHSYTADEQPEEYKITIRAKVKFEDIGKSKVLWESTIEGFGTYAADATDDTSAKEEAISLLIQRIIQRVREG